MRLYMIAFHPAGTEDLHEYYVAAEKQTEAVDLLKQQISSFTPESFGVEESDRYSLDEVPQPGIIAHLVVRWTSD
jgi:hypothetical protein